MTVSELINKLNEYDKDLEVIIDCEDRYVPLEPKRVVTEHWIITVFNDKC